MTKISAHEIVLYATNTGSLYPTHKKLAREGATQQKWFEHVTNRVIPLYRREIEHVLAWPSDRFDAAAQLKAYYERHIAEVA